VLIFVHGYNVTPESAMATAGQLAYDVGFTGATIAFVWPSRASLDRYASDEESAQWAAPHLAELIRHLKNKPDRPVHLVAHSMGTRVACGALQRLACARGAGAGAGPGAGELPKLGQLVLAAADIDADIFKAQIVDEIRPLVAAITLYASRDDAALKLSQRIHKWTRAGETGDWVPAGEQRFEMVDCSGLDLSRAVGDDLIGHSYYSAGHVTEDLQSVLGTSNAPRRATREAGARYLTLRPPRTPPRGFSWR
jgi:esterase/lipase superfamily enzyme